MRPSLVILLTMVTLLSAGVLSATVETRQTKLLLNRYATSSRHEAYLGRSLRLAKTLDESDSVMNERKSSGVEERGNPISAIVSKVSENIPIGIKLGWWETIGKSTNQVKKKLGLENVYGPALATYETFPTYLNYVNRIEKHGMWEDARRYVTTLSVWQEMEKKVGRTINTADDLKAIQDTNAFRVYKRYANIFDDNIVSIMGSGYYPPKNWGDDRKASHMEKMIRAEIWGESKRDFRRVKEWLGLRWANDEELARNPYYKHYMSTLETAKTPAKNADIDALEKFILAPRN